MPRLSRRELLRAGGRVALAAAAAGLAGASAGCARDEGAGTHPSPTGAGAGPTPTTGTSALPATTAAPPTSTVPASTTVAASTTTTLAPPRSLAELAAALEGRLVRPPDPAYGAARLVYDLRYAGAAPAAIAYCRSAGDVAACVAFARAAGLAPIPRSGGHSYGGYSTGEGLVIDVTAMNATSFDAATSTAAVGAGTLLVDLYAACAAAGALVPGGSCPTVGLAGLALGGGAGVLGRNYGLTCDNLLAIELVTAAGEILTCSEENQPELFWACRGGGGRNFGIVTSFRFRTAPIPALCSFTLEWPFSEAPGVLAAWQQWMADAPDALWSNCQLLYEGSAGAHLRSSGVYVGGTAALATLLAALTKAAGAPSYEGVGADGYLGTMLLEAGCAGSTVEQCHLSGQTPSGVLSRAMFNAKSAFFSEPMPAAGAEAAAEAIEALVSAGAEVGAGLVFDAYGGAINAVAKDATAFVHRDALCCAQISMSFSPDADPATIGPSSGWLQTTAASLAPYGNGEAYQNYIDPTLADWQHAYYGTNLSRLAAVRRAADPDDVFCFAQSIPLSLS